MKQSKSVAQGQMSQRVCGFLGADEEIKTSSGRQYRFPPAENRGGWGSHFRGGAGPEMLPQCPEFPTACPTFFSCRPKLFLPSLCDLGPRASASALGRNRFSAGGESMDVLAS
jgi:hypothetical protein